MSSSAIAVRHRASSLADSPWRLLFELLLIVPAYTAYQLVRGMVGGSAGAAFDNAIRVIDIEQRLGIFHEANLQQLILPQVWMVDIFNYLYIYAHLPLIIIVAFWLYGRHRENYALFRNAFMISGLIALVGFTTVPLAPPRYMPEFGFSDTIISAQSYYVFQNPKIVNQYAAMPSLHFGWDMLVAIALVYNTRSVALRIIAIVMPVVMLGGIVLTGNHYFLDAVAGALVACVGLGVAYLLRRMVSRDGAFSFLT